jgi:hypothetical protein
MRRRADDRRWVVVIESGGRRVELAVTGRNEQVARNQARQVLMDGYDETWFIAEVRRASEVRV